MESELTAHVAEESVMARKGSCYTTVNTDRPVVAERGGLHCCLCLCCNGCGGCEGEYKYFFHIKEILRPENRQP